MNNTSNYDVKMAQHLRTRDNIEPEGPLLGEIIVLEPLTISIYNGNAIITQGNKCYICSSLINNYSRAADVSLNNISGSGTITYKDILKVKDKVLCLPTSDGQTFFILDKVVV